MFFNSKFIAPLICFKTWSRLREFAKYPSGQPWNEPKFQRGQLSHRNPPPASFPWAATPPRWASTQQDPCFRGLPLEMQSHECHLPHTPGEAAEKSATPCAQTSAVTHDNLCTPQSVRAGLVPPKVYRTPLCCKPTAHPHPILSSLSPQKIKNYVSAPIHKTKVFY